MMRTLILMLSHALQLSGNSPDLKRLLHYTISLENDFQKKWHLLSSIMYSLAIRNIKANSSHAQCNTC